MFNNVSKERFRQTANKLLNECFILKKDQKTRENYFFILNNKELFKNYFEPLGYEILINEDMGVIGLNNMFGTGRVQLLLSDSIILLLLRLIYVEQRRKITQTNDVLITLETLYDKYALININRPLDKTTIRASLRKLKRYNIIHNLDNDLADMETRIIIYPSIMFVIPNSNIEQMYVRAEERLNQYGRGGEEDDAEDSDEEVDGN